MLLYIYITHMVPAHGYGCQHMRYGDEEEEQPKLTSLLSSQNMERISTYATTKYRDSQ